MNKEIWKDIPGYEGLYQASNFGNILSKKRSGAKEKILNGEIDSFGYLRVTLCKNGKVRKYKKHRLIALTFIPNPNKLPQVNHKNGNKKDNRIENLEWCSASYNTIHSYEKGLNKTKGNITKVINKTNGEKKEYRSMRDASINMGYNKGYLFKKMKKNIFENEEYIWLILNKKVHNEQ